MHLKFCNTALKEPTLVNRDSDCVHSLKNSLSVMPQVDTYYKKNLLTQKLLKKYTEIIHE